MPELFEGLCCKRLLAKSERGCKTSRSGLLTWAERANAPGHPGLRSGRVLVFVAQRKGAPCRTRGT